MSTDVDTLDSGADKISVQEPSEAAIPNCIAHAGPTGQGAFPLSFRAELRRFWSQGNRRSMPNLSSPGSMAAPARIRSSNESSTLDAARSRLFAIALLSFAGLVIHGSIAAGNGLLSWFKSPERRLRQAIKRTDPVEKLLLCLRSLPSYLGWNSMSAAPPQCTWSKWELSN